jgi:hypothetical protein
MEHNHIDNSKKPSKGTQQWADSIERQTVTRSYENLVLQHATELLVCHNMLSSNPTFHWQRLTTLFFKVIGSA